MKISGTIFALSIVLTLSSCDLINTDNSLTTGEVVAGLKKALEIGADSASGSLSQHNGYYHGDILHVKIPLPPEAENVRQLITNNDLAAYFNLDQKFENVIVAVNRAAEKAAKDATPIFGTAIKDLTISQGWDILNGIVPEDSGYKAADFDSTAATQFLKLETYDELTSLYAGPINAALDEDTELGFSAVDAWNTLTTSYNTTLNSNAVQAVIFASQFTSYPIHLPPAIETDLGVFSTQKALNGLFYMVGNEEKKIRKDPYQWAEDIIQKVFGSVLNNQ
jgi:hypothetical protein